MKTIVIAVLVKTKVSHLIVTQLSAIEEGRHRIKIC